MSAAVLGRARAGYKVEVVPVAQGARIRTDPAVALAALVSKNARLPAPFSSKDQPMHWWLRCVSLAAWAWIEFLAGILIPAKESLIDVLSWCVLSAC